MHAAYCSYMQTISRVLQQMKESLLIQKRMRGLQGMVSMFCWG